VGGRCPAASLPKRGASMIGSADQKTVVVEELTGRRAGSPLGWMASAAVLSSTRWTRLVPGTGTISIPLVSSQAGAT